MSSWVKQKRPVFERPKMFYDIEVYEHDWFICFEDEDGNRDFVHNGGILKLHNIVKKYTLVGFNNYHYDDRILGKILEYGSKCVQDPNLIKQANDDIIINKKHWFPPFTIHSLDARSGMPMNMSLKKVESYNGGAIEETQVGFDIGRKLTEDELEKEIKYCFYDVEWARDTFRSREGDFLLKEFLYDQVYHIKPMAYRTTNVSMINIMFGGYEKTNDRILPKPELFNKLPLEVQDLFKHGKMTASTKGQKLDTITVHTETAEMVFSGGGGHGETLSLDTYFENVVLVDGNSLYPSIMILFKMFGYDLTKLLQSFIDERFKRKSVGDPTEVIYKLLVNSLYGILGSQYYDKEDGVYCKALRESVCLIGQTSLYDLTLRYEEVGAHVININTDGIAFVGQDIGDDTIERINKEFTDDWGIVLSIDKFTQLWQKDVNNYIGIEPDGKVKVKGAAVTRYDIPKALDKNELILKNTSNTIIDYMLTTVLTDGSYNELNEDYIIPYLKLWNQKLGNVGKTGVKKADRESIKEELEIIRETLHNHIKYNYMSTFRDMFDKYGVLLFCRTIYTTKAYPELHIMDGDDVVEKIQKVNRVFASNDGVLIKRFAYEKTTTSKKTGETTVSYNVHDKIQSLPDSVTVINTDLKSASVSFDDIDIDFYVNEIVNRIILFHTHDEFDEKMFD